MAAPAQTTPAPAVKVPHVDVGAFAHVLHLLWPVVLVVVVVGAARLGLDLRRQLRLRRAGMNEIDRMDGTTFELKLASLFRQLGYSVEVVGRRGDFGADLLVARDGSRTAVQAKRWSKNVGIDAVNQVVGARGYYSTDHAMVVTNSHFTTAARTQAERNGVALWDRKKLVDQLLKGQGNAPAPAEAQRSAPAPTSQVATPQPQTPAYCARCGAPVSEKVLAYCRAYPRRFAGLVYCFEHQRAFP